MTPSDLKTQAFAVIDRWRENGKIREKNLTDLSLAVSPGINNNYLGSMYRIEKYKEVIREIKAYFRGEHI